MLFGRNRNLIGLDIGDSSVKLVQLAELPKGRGWQVSKLDTLETPRGRTGWEGKEGREEQVGGRKGKLWRTICRFFFQTQNAYFVGNKSDAHQPSQGTRAKRPRLVTGIGVPEI